MTTATDVLLQSQNADGGWGNRLNAMDSKSGWMTAWAERVWLFSGTIRSNVHRFGALPVQQVIHARQDPLKRILDACLATESEKLYQGIWLTTYRAPANHQAAWRG